MAGRHVKTPRSHLGPIASAAVVAAVLVGGAGAAHFAPQWTDASEPAPAVTTTTAESSPSSTPAPASPSPTAASPTAASPSPTRADAAAATASPRPSRTPARASRNNTRSAAPAPAAPKPAAGAVTSGTCGASYYDEGQATANGEQFDPEALTAAHKTLAFNTRVRVTNPGNGKSVVVRINDRGPFVSGRCIDLSRAAFRAIASLGMGELTVKYEVLGK
ncbi:septal ring lytic transglycosylase RlpA family protein [Micromonospora sp. NPDC049679]|uniref:septal ring lytic transglycosylase RlpA family protein n=1 Tax=Micromonospora sp. NPDC049679 TaxID=3155920 RepID=UPI0033E21110